MWSEDVWLCGWTEKISVGLSIFLFQHVWFRVRGALNTQDWTAGAIKSEAGIEKQGTIWSFANKMYDIYVKKKT